jgi:MerR family transcriptional regulator/heat shock protein HspR
MTVGQYQIGLCPADDQQLTLNELALHVHVHPSFVERLVDFGLVTPIRQEGAVLFDASAVSRLRTIIRLRQTLGINLAGISVVLEMIDKLCTLQREIEKAKNAYNLDM